MVFTARIRRSVVIPIDEPVAGCSPTKYRLSDDQIDTLELDDVASDYSRAIQGPFLPPSYMTTLTIASDQGYRLPVEMRNTLSSNPHTRRARH